MKRFFDTVNIVLLLCMIGAALAVWPDLPDRIPVHFGIDGRPDGWAEKSLTSWFLLPGVAVALTVACHIVPEAADRGAQVGTQ